MLKFLISFAQVIDKRFLEYLKELMGMIADKATRSATEIKIYNLAYSKVYPTTSTASTTTAESTTTSELPLHLQPKQHPQLLVPKTISFNVSHLDVQRSRAKAVDDTFIVHLDQLMKQIVDDRTKIKLQHQILDLVHDGRVSPVQGSGVDGVNQKFLDYFESLMETIADHGTKFNLQDKTLDLVYSEIH